MFALNSPVQEFEVFGRKFWLKRDDLIDADFDGNKARKFYSLLGAKLQSFCVISSFGGVQSNAMYTLSILAKKQNIKFRYYTKELPKYLKNSPSGNLKAALANGMELLELSGDEYEAVAASYKAKDGELFVPQGGACEYAKEGLRLLGEELNDFCTAQDMKSPKAVVSCGTGTSALYLADCFKGEVFAVPCVGDATYLQKQFEALSPHSKQPTILATNKKYHFGKLYAEIYEMYKELLACGVEFDLLYDCVAWICVKEHLEMLDEDTIFVHSGGLRGNETMLERYARKSGSF